MIFQKGHAVIGSSTSDHSSGHISYWDMKGEHVWSVTFMNDHVLDLLYADVPSRSDLSSEPSSSSSTSHSATPTIVASFASGSLQAFSAAKGKLLWSAQMPSPCVLLRGAAGADTLSAVSFHPTVTRTSVDARTGAVSASDALAGRACAKDTHLSGTADDVTALCISPELDAVHVITPAAATTLPLPEHPASPDDVTLTGDVIAIHGGSASSASYYVLATKNNNKTNTELPCKPAIMEKNKNHYNKISKKQKQNNIVYV